eukprot:gnl/TRDRNA2_/TRDRNA2_207955_c0_seq1.p1 gnl/TRDRNA2_/TRDRNA2_207955_c0~~gnl/TRDRNA2_/TRDRNA2_207955_c0_seq1.p1  ORF type:complete len:302 (-),score=15.55 gnl/TRDRNA2_/TRDRNA2_207955_c0_seq1:37-828(-)
MGGAVLCAEQLAYTHCLIENMLASDWVMMLHAPDEYVVLPQTSNDIEFPGNVQGMIEILAPLRPSRFRLAELYVLHLPHSRQGNCLARRGSTIRCSLLSSPYYDLNRGSPLLNPDYCLASNAHQCISTRVPEDSLRWRWAALVDYFFTRQGNVRRPIHFEPSGTTSQPSTYPAPILFKIRDNWPDCKGYVQVLGVLGGLHHCLLTTVASATVMPGLLRVNHYVEMLPEDAGRCERIAGSPCSVLDESGSPSTFLSMLDNSSDT